MKTENKQLIEDLLKIDEPGVRLKVLVDVLERSFGSDEVRQKQQAFQESELVRALFSEVKTGHPLIRDSYSKWRGGHWCLSILADFPYPQGDERLLLWREQQFEWLFGKHHQDTIKKRMINGLQRRCASQEGNAVFSQLRLGIADDRVHRLVESLIKWQWPDGGWNCDKNPEAKHSSFMETLFPLRGLMEYTQYFGHPAAKQTAERAADIFLKRSLYLRQCDGSVMRRGFDKLHYPCYWHYDILFGLKVMSEGGWQDDPRCEKALDLLESKRLSDNGFPMEERYYHKNPDKTGYSPIDWGGTSKRKLNPWVSVDALTVLKRAGRL
ncbi:MAG: hypothetical protein K8R40_09125 [Anaerolineaceae bacterium]|nr:hypothetical protein [Anaerolineaceae bacterium]